MPAKDAIVYSLISKGSTILVDYSEKSANFIEVSKQLLSKIQSNRDSKSCYNSEE
jgi:hypothetical protein